MAELTSPKNPSARDFLPEKRPYTPRGTLEQLFYTDAPEVLVSGPAGTGKSRAILELIHRRCEQCPGSRWLVFRKTRESMTESVLVTFEDHVLPPAHPAHPSHGGASRRMRQAYQYPNGSTIVVGGMDKPSKIMSTEYDGAYCQEAIELTENDWEMVTTRLRNGRMPYAQILGDTNPDTPRHWLKLREAAGRLKVIESRHEDNPVLFRDGAWTEEGARYVAKLDALTGPRKQRLRFGRWVQAEGVVYEGWDRAVHLADGFPDGRRLPPLTWDRYLAVDFGFTHPFVCQWWAQDPDGRLWMYREIYRTKRLVEDHARDILRAMGALTAGKPDWSRPSEPPPVAVLCDHDAEDRATLERHLGQSVRAARKTVSPGIQEVAARLEVQADGKPRLYVLRDCLVERDLELADAKKPTSTPEEFDSYVWDLDGKRKKGEEPVKKDDHGMDALRYVVAHFIRGMEFVPPPLVPAPRRDILTPHHEPAPDVRRPVDGIARRHLFGR